LTLRPGHSVDEANTTACLSPSSTTLGGVKVDPAELLDPSEVAAVIGLANANGVSVYRRRYDDFPSPVIEKGRCVLWRRQDVERWAARR
jgi:predicted DNA-binding transcriptional regulator AlpA